METHLSWANSTLQSSKIGSTVHGLGAKPIKLSIAITVLQSDCSSIFKFCANVGLLFFTLLRYFPQSCTDSQSFCFQSPRSVDVYFQVTLYRRSRFSFSAVLTSSPVFARPSSLSPVPESLSLLCRSRDTQPLLLLFGNKVNGDIAL